MIEVSELSRRYGDLLAVDRLSFRVSAGEVVGFLGPNGAGKSTTLRMLTGFLAPSSGRARVAGYDISTESLQARRQLGYMPETCPLYPELRVEEFLGFRARLKHVESRRVRQRVNEAMVRAGIHHRRGSLIGQLSKGLRQRVGIADALVAAPPLLILDEPTAGLDPNQIREVRALLRELKQDHTILLSTHILAEAEVVCDRVIVLCAGRLVAEGSLAELLERQNPHRAELTLEGLDASETTVLSEALGDWIQLENTETLGRTARWDIELRQPELGLAPVLEKLLARGVQVREARLRRTSLEEVFAELTFVEGSGKDKKEETGDG